MTEKGDPSAVWVWATIAFVIMSPLIMVGVSLLHLEYVEQNRGYMNETITIHDKIILPGESGGFLTLETASYYVETDRGTLTAGFNIFSTLIEGRTYNVRTYNNHIYEIYGGKP